MVRFRLSALLFLLSFVSATAQNPSERILKYDSTIFPGKVVLADGTLMEGQIHFNYKEGFLSFRQGQESISFQPEAVGYFEFIDTKNHRIRKYYSVEYRDPDTGVSDMYFCEVLKELKTFALLAKMGRIHATSISVKRNHRIIRAPDPTMKQTETVFFISDTGEIVPYLEIIEIETDAMVDFHYKRNKFINEDAFAEFTEPYHLKLVAFANLNDLNFKRKQDLIEILDEYERLTAAQSVDK